MNDLVLRFIRYAGIDTGSDPSGTGSPSTSGQTALLGFLRDELAEMGVSEVRLDPRGVLYGAVPGGRGGITLGLIAHVDTSPAVPGAGVKPRIHRDWDGSCLEIAPGLSLDTSECPELARWKGGSIITSDGSTLLGADDKAGVAIIMEAVRWMMENPAVPRPRVAVAFTPDEEIGRGMDNFDVKAFGADLAYTVDGEQPGSVDSATFNACRADWTVRGVEVHPGSAFGRLVNPVRIAGELLAMMKPEEMPENSRGDQGFEYPMEISGDSSKAVMSMLLRDFTDHGLAARVERMRSLERLLALKHPRAEITLEITRQYSNPAEILRSDRRLAEYALKGAAMAGLEPRETSIRGGTDGSRLSFMGVPTVNLPTGGGFFHSRREWVAVEGMEKALESLINTLRVWGENPGERGCSGNPKGL
jgi:tripeptide aminopeptidase